jgi:hypothetical protein
MFKHVMCFVFTTKQVPKNILNHPHLQSMKHGELPFGYLKNGKSYIYRSFMMMYLSTMVIFHGYVTSPKGI